jgi:hypothetical protein
MENIETSTLENTVNLYTDADYACLDLSAFEMDAEFRAMELSYIRLCNRYIKSIFFNVFVPKNNKKLYKKRRQILKDTFDNNDDAETEDLFEKALKILDIKNDGSALDCLQNNFCKNILKPLCDHSDVRVAVYEKMANDYDLINWDIVEKYYAICPKTHGWKPKKLKNYLTIDNSEKNIDFFIDAIFVLTKRRNYLEHYNKPKGRGQSEKDKYNGRRKTGEKHYTDREFLDALSLFLLPNLAQEFRQQIESFEHRLKKLNRLDESQFQHEVLKEFFKEQSKKRKQASKFVTDQIHNRAATTNKVERKAKHSFKHDWRGVYLDSPNMIFYRDDYKEGEFKRRFYFIGKTTINQIRALIKKDSVDTRLHFRHDIETLYFLRVRIHWIIQRTMFRCGIDADTIQQNIAQHPLYPDLQTIRDCIAHDHEGFWRFHPLDTPDAMMPVGEVFRQIFCLLNHKRLSLKWGDLSDEEKEKFKQENQEKWNLPANPKTKRKLLNEPDRFLDINVQNFKMELNLLTQEVVALLEDECIFIVRPVNDADKNSREQKRWNKRAARKYDDNPNYTIDKRRALKTIIKRWVLDIKNAANTAKQVSF